MLLHPGLSVKIEKASQSFGPAGPKAVKSVFCRDMCVAENTLREACVALPAKTGKRHEAERSLLIKMTESF